MLLRFLIHVPARNGRTSLAKDYSHYGATGTIERKPPLMTCLPPADGSATLHLVSCFLWNTPGRRTLCLRVVGHNKTTRRLIG
jgi:hypothetical protein